MRRRLVFFVLVALLPVLAGCSGDGKEDRKIDRKKPGVRMGAREGVWRGLKLLEASLNHRNLKGYLKVFSGVALRGVEKELTEAKFRKNIRGRYKLGAFHIIKRHSRSVVSARYVLYQYLPGAREPKKIKGEGMFAATPGRRYWSIILFK